MSDTPASDGVPRVIERKTLHKGRKFDFDSLTVERDGGRYTLQGVRHPGAVVLLPILDTHEGRQVVMIRNFRPLLGEQGKTIWELPAGTIDPGEAVEVAAHRELTEETGYRAGHLAPLGRFYTTPGMTDEVMWAFAAYGLRHEGQRLEADEWMTVEPVPVSRALAMVESGDLADAKSMLALLMAQRRGML